MYCNLYRINVEWNHAEPFLLPNLIHWQKFTSYMLIPPFLFKILSLLLLLLLLIITVISSVNLNEHPEYLTSQEPRKPSYAEICQRIREAPTQQPPVESKLATTSLASTDELASIESADLKSRETRSVSAKPAAHRARDAWKCPQGAGDMTPQSCETGRDWGPSEH